LEITCKLTITLGPNCCAHKSSSIPCPRVYGVSKPWSTLDHNLNALINPSHGSSSISRLISLSRENELETTFQIRMRLEEKVKYFRPNNNKATLHVMKPLSVLFLVWSHSKLNQTFFFWGVKFHTNVIERISLSQNIFSWRSFFPLHHLVTYAHV